MSVHGIRIADKEKSSKDPSFTFLSPSLVDILVEIDEPDSYYWRILFLDGTYQPQEATFLNPYIKKVNESEGGILTSCLDLTFLSKKFFQIFEILLIASRNKNVLKSYKNDEKMYKMCEIVIELIDSAFWEVHTHDESLILKLKKKFKQTELLS